MKYYLDHTGHLGLYFLGFNIVLVNFFILLFKQCRHIVQKVKYDQKIYRRKNTSLSPNLVPRVNTSTFWTCPLRYSPSCFQSSFTTTDPSSFSGFCCSALISCPGNEPLLSYFSASPHHTSGYSYGQCLCYYDHADIAYCLFNFSKCTWLCQVLVASHGMFVSCELLVVASRI